jgi:hypothetical protein
MKQPGLCLAWLMAAVTPVFAQVTVEVLQDQDQFLQGEALIAKVRVVNRSGQTLHLGASEDWLTFSIESREGAPVNQLGNAPVLGEFALESSKMATKRVDLAPYFSVLQPGSYSIVATVRIKEWDRQLSSPPKHFEIIGGARLWEQDVGIPSAAGSTASAPEVRKYILQQANYLKKRLQLYLRLTDASGAKVFRVVPVGPLVSFSRPEPQVDRLSRLHLLFQNGPHTFSYTVFDPDGALVTRQTYLYANSRPRLQVDDEGQISVKGGARQVSADDFPPPPSETTPSRSTPEEQKPPRS